MDNRQFRNKNNEFCLSCRNKTPYNVELINGCLYICPLCMKNYWEIIDTGKRIYLRSKK